MNNYERTQKLIKMYKDTKPVHEQLPVTIDGFEITEMNMDCQVCKRPIHKVNLHGRVSVLTSSIVSLHFVGVCTECKMITEGVQRIKRIAEKRLRIEELTKGGLWKCSEINTNTDNWFVALLKRMFWSKRNA